MEVEGQITVQVSREEVIEEMQKPEVLERVIPQCKSLEQVEEHRYRGEVSERISMVSLDMEFDVEIVEFNPPDSFTAKIDGTAPGSNTDVTGEMRYKLTEENGGTLIDYHMDIEVTGKLASLGFRMLKSTVKNRIQQMADNSEEYFEEYAKA